MKVKAEGKVSSGVFNRMVEHQGGVAATLGHDRKGVAM